MPKGHDPSQAFENLYTAKNSDDSSLRFGPFNSAIVQEDDTQLSCAAAPTVLCPSGMLRTAPSVGIFENNLVAHSLTRVPAVVRILIAPPTRAAAFGLVSTECTKRRSVFGWI
jgi:hypothetical protein